MNDTHNLKKANIKSHLLERLQSLATVTDRVTTGDGWMTVWFETERTIEELEMWNIYAKNA